MTKVSSLCILIPCHNEGVSIFDVVAEYKIAFPQAGILVVDNASTDETGLIAAEAGTQVLHEPRKGKTCAVIRNPRPRPPGMPYTVTIKRPS